MMPPRNLEDVERISDGMDNQIGADKSIDYPGIEISMGVGYDADTNKPFPQRFAGHVLSFLFSVSYRLNMKQIQIFHNEWKDLYITI